MSDGRVIAVDGPAGAGKSSACRALAERLGFAYVDTGAMYRIVGVLAAARGIALDDDIALAGLAADVAFDIGPDGVTASGGVGGAAIRTVEAADLASRVSTRPGVRRWLVAEQRRLGGAHDVVMEGRDIGTVVFPNAPLKIFLTAAPEERARRRARELELRGERVDVAALAAELARRDERDSTREDSPLRPADDAHRLDTTTLDLPAVVERMLGLARDALGISSEA